MSQQLLLLPTAARALLCAGLLALYVAPSWADSWVTAPRMPTARGGLAAATSTDGSKIYALGGTGVLGVLNTVEVYDAPARNWRAIAPCLVAWSHRYYASRWRGASALTVFVGILRV